MIKLTIFVKRKEGLSKEEFTHYWKHEHPKLLLSLPHFNRLVRRYVQQHATAIPGESLTKLPYDGYAELWFDDADKLAEALGNELYPTVIAEDEAKFSSRSEMTFLVTEEHSVI